MKNATLFLYESTISDMSPNDWATDFKMALSQANRENFKNAMKNLSIIDKFNEGRYDIRKVRKITETLKDKSVKEQMSKFLAFGITPNTAPFFDGLRSDLIDAGLKDQDKGFAPDNFKTDLLVYMSAIDEMKIEIESITNMAAGFGGTKLYGRMREGISNAIPEGILGDIQKYKDDKENDALQKQVLSESATAFKTNWDELFSEKNSYETFMNEGVIGRAAGDAVDKVKSAASSVEKATEWFDNIVNKKIAAIKEAEKRNQADQVVKGSLSISHEITRALKTLPFNLIHPGLGWLLYLGSHIWAQKTQHIQRAEYIADLKTAEKVVDEMMNQADSSGDKKGKIQLIQEKDRIIRARERLERHNP